ncbi:MAG: DUF3108 domain-containing protein [Pseudomonadales bacterium]|nr:DUF3108 domain-containing protein [Pseudomonadales bacterium]
MTILNHCLRRPNLFKGALKYFNTIFRTILFCCLIAGSPLSADELLKTSSPLLYQAKYKAKIRGISLNLEEVFKALAGNQFEIDVSAKTFYASIHQRSLFTLEKNIPVPVLFASAQKILGSSRNYKIKFDAGSAHYRKGDTKIDLEVPAGVQDILSVKLVLRNWLSERTGETEIEFPVVSKKKLKQYKFVVAEEEVLQISVGRFNAIRVEQIKAGKKSAIFWFAIDWGYMLLKMEADDDGKSESVELDSGMVDGRTMIGW